MPDSPLRHVLAIASVAMLAAGSTACATGGVGLRDPLADDDVRTLARVLSVADARRADTAILHPAVRSPSATIRRAAVLAMGQVKATASAPLLRTLLFDADSSVAARAAFSLALLRDTAAVGALDSALAGPWPVAVQAAFALGEIGAPARAAILAAVPVAADGRVRSELLLAAAKLRPIPAQEIAAQLTSDDPCVRWAAAYPLSRNRVPGGVRPLVAMSSDPRVAAADGRAPVPAGAYECAPSETRAQIARALAPPAPGDSLLGLAMPVLRRLVADPAPHVRINALRSLATIPDSGVELLVAATRDRDANVRVAAAQSLSGRALAGSLWDAVWRADSGLMFRRSLLESATRANAVLQAHESWRTASDWRMRAALADAAALAPNVTRGAQLALPLLGDADPRVRQSAYAAIAAFLDSIPDRQARRETVLGGLRDPDFFVRATALLALADSARASEVPAVLESYALAARDPGNDARIAAIRHVANAWRRDSAQFGDSLRQRVSSLDPSPDPLVRAEARGISLLLAWPGTAGTARPDRWYQEVVRAIVFPSLRGVPARARIDTERGSITLELLGEDAPLTVENFTRLARSGYYRNVRFHRVVPNFVAQDGDPRGDGNGGPGYAIRDELNLRRYSRGAVGMALSGPDTGGSQYFLTLSPQPHLDARYTIFARVVGGADVMDALVQGDVIHDIIVP